MATYRTGNHWGVTIVRETDGGCTGFDRCVDIACNHQDAPELVAVVVNQDQALAERICTLLNGVEAYAYSCLGCGKRYALAQEAADCDAAHRAHAKRVQEAQP